MLKHAYSIANMKFLILPFVVAAVALPAPQTLTIVIEQTLIPAFGIDSGIPSVKQLGSCQGANDIDIPCQCPPTLDNFAARLSQFVAAGDVFGIEIAFPTDSSVQSQLARIDACIDTLQNMDDTVLGQGCPIAAAPNFGAIQASLLQQL
jgi:hypothetical protein